MDCHVPAKQKSHHVFSVISSWNNDNLKDLKVYKLDVTSALSLQQCGYLECERMRSSRSWLLGFLCRCFLTYRLNPFVWGIWNDRRAFKEQFVLVIWTTNWSHMKNKGTKQKFKKKGSENAFGCDLTEHLQNSGQDGKLFYLALYFTPSPAAIIKLHMISRTSDLTCTWRITVILKTYFYWSFQTLSSL